MTKKKKILVIQTAFIGDAILTLPMLQKLKEMHQESLVDVIAIPSTAEIFSASPAVDEVIILDKRGEHKSIFSMIRFSKFIKNRNYEVIYAPHRSFRTTFLVMQSGVKETFGFSNSSMFHAYKNVVEYIPSDHDVKRNLSLIGFTTDDNNWKITPEIRSDDSVIQKVNNIMLNKAIDIDFIAVAPGSVWKTKRYPTNYLKEVIQKLTDSNNKVVLFGSGIDRKLCEELIIDNNKNVISVAGELTIIESIELLKKAKLLITNDSAPTHMGMSADIPVLTIYCSTIPEFGFYPYNKKSKSLSLVGLDCKPCGIHGYDECPLKHFNCAYNLKPEIILANVEEMLGATNN